MEYIQILKEENEVITEVLECQKVMKNSVDKKNWTSLLDVMSRINLLRDRFNSRDEERAKAAVQKTEDSEEERNLLCEIRGKLVKSRTENKVLSEYINITRGFIQGILDEAFPQNKNTVYTRKGYAQKLQPESVVVSRHL